MCSPCRHRTPAARQHLAYGGTRGRGTGPSVGFGLRIVTYTLRRIELLEESILEAPDEEHVAIAASSAAVRRRMLGQW